MSRFCADLVVGAEVEQPPRWVHEVGEVVEETQASPDRLDADLLQPVVLRRDRHRKTQLERNRRAWAGGGERREVLKEEQEVGTVGTQFTNVNKLNLMSCCNKSDWILHATCRNFAHEPGTFIIFSCVTTCPDYPAQHNYYSFFPTFSTKQTGVTLTLYFVRKIIFVLHHRRDTHQFFYNKFLL